MNPVLLIAIPLLFGFLSVFSKKISKVLLYVASIFNVISLFTYTYGSYDIGGFKAPYGISLLLDEYAFVALFFLNGLFLLLLITNLDKIKNFSIVLLIALAGLNGLLLTNDLFNLFVFLEISGIAAYIITTQNKKVLFSFQYLVLGTVGSGLYLLGLIMLYGMVGTLNMTDVITRLSDVSSEQVMIPVLLMFIGIGVEAKLLPFGSWVKGILQHASSLVGVLISSIYAGVILFVFGRLFTEVFVLSDTLVTILVVITTFTLIAGEFAAFASNKLREILLFSSIAQAGLITLLFVLGLPLLGTLFIINNILSKFIMFTIAGRISDQYENDSLSQLRGLFSKHKFLGFSFSVAALSVAGLPLFFGFIVKLNTLYNLFIDGNQLIPAVILITSVIEGSYLIKILVKMWSSGNEGELASEKTEVTITKRPIITMVVLLIAVVIIVLGVLPQSNLVFTEQDSVYPVKIIEQWGGLIK